MKKFNYIGQLLAALVYTPIYMYLIYLLLYLTSGWIVTLNIGIVIILTLVFGGLAIGLFLLLQKIILYPYRWITHKNLPATAVSSALCVLIFGYDVYRLWDLFLEYGTKGGIDATIFSIVLLIITIDSIRAFVKYYHNKDTIK